MRAEEIECRVERLKKIIHMTDSDIITFSRYASHKDSDVVDKYINKLEKSIQMYKAATK